MRAGPKAAVDGSPLPWRPRSTGAARFAAFCDRFVVTPKGTGARRPMRLRPWQVELTGSILDPDPRPRLAGWLLPRGQGKSTLVAALGLYDLMTGEEGASVVVAATDERQAGIVFGIAARMVELHPDLSGRVQAFAQKLVVPERGASFVCLPAEPKRLEGLDPTLAILDEAGVASRDVYEVLALAQGKRESSTMLAIGTPGPDPYSSVLSDMRDYARAHPHDGSFVWREHSAAAFIDHPVDCRHCWQLANPALGDFLHEDAMRALLPPKMRESTFRRARLCQFVTAQEGAFLPEHVWRALCTGEVLAPGSEVVVALDGSFNSDATALLMASVSARPHLDVLGLWEPPAGDADWRVPVADVEDAIRAAAREYRVVEVIADPFRWTRTLQALAAEGLPVVEFPHSTSRLTAATTDLYKAAIAGEVTHSGDPDLTRHVTNAVVVEDARGVRLDKGKGSSTRRIDLAACAVMAHSRATWRATRPGKPRRRMLVAP